LKEGEVAARLHNKAQAGMSSDVGDFKVIAVSAYQNLEI
jgi:hypothetical protein